MENFEKWKDSVEKKIKKLNKQVQNTENAIKELQQKEEDSMKEELNQETQKGATSSKKRKASSNSSPKKKIKGEKESSFVELEKQLKSIKNDIETLSHKNELIGGYFCIQGEQRNSCLGPTFSTFLTRPTDTQKQITITQDQLNEMNQIILPNSK